jgi:hypothetical protein
MPKKAATPASPEPPEETGVPIVVRRAMIKDDTASPTAATTGTADAGNPIEVKSKKARIEPLATKAEDPKPVEPAVPVEKPAPAAAQAPAATVTKPVEPAVPAPEPTKAAAVPAKPADKAPKPTDGTSEFTLAGEDSVATPEDPSQNPIDQARPTKRRLKSKPRWTSWSTPKPISCHSTASKSAGPSSCYS